MTLEKLSLKILIKDVMSRMLVMHTKISWEGVSAIEDRENILLIP
jgi:hypothetical protein